MQAVFETGGKQYRATVGESVNVEFIFQEIGKQVELDRVLMITDDSGIQVGTPTVAGAKIIAKIADHGLDRKRVVFKYQNKKRIRVKRGHRQLFTRLLIEDIVR